MTPSATVDVPATVTATPPAPTPNPDSTSQEDPSTSSPSESSSSDATRRTSESTRGRGSGRGRGRGQGQGRGQGRGRGYDRRDARSSRSQDSDSDQPSSSGDRRPWPGREPREMPAPMPFTPPVYAEALSGYFAWPRTRHHAQRPDFLAEFPLPRGKTFNVNSFLGKRDPGGGQYLVPPNRYLEFLTDYHASLEAGYQMYLTENYHQQVFKYFVELDWEWDTDLALVMDVTPPLLDLIARVAGDFYKLPYPNMITSIRSPYKVHINFPQLLTTEMLACLCRDRILEACRERFPQHADTINWERLIDFPHGSLRLMGSRKTPVMDRDPDWVVEKAYYPARLTDGKWRPGKLTVALLGAASIFPPPRQAAAFERTPAYVDMIFSDLAAYKEKMEERRRRRAAEKSGGAFLMQLPEGSSKDPLHVKIEVKEDETVALNVYIKSRYRTKVDKPFTSSSSSSSSGDAGAAETAAAAVVADAAATMAPAGVDAAGRPEAGADSAPALGLPDGAAGRGGDGANGGTAADTIAVAAAAAVDISTVAAGVSMPEVGTAGDATCVSSEAGTSATVAAETAPPAEGLGVWDNAGGDKRGTGGTPSQQDEGGGAPADPRSGGEGLRVLSGEEERAHTQAGNGAATPAVTAGSVILS